MAEAHIEPVLSSDRIRECAQVVRDYRVRIGGSSFEWADITYSLADVLDQLANYGEEVDRAGLHEAMVCLLEAIESAVRHT